MLQVVSLASPQLKKAILDEFLTNSSDSTWVVSDLRNKFEVQQFILETQDSFEDLSVLRASELWRFLLKRIAPDINLVSRDFVRVWVREKLRQEEVQFAAQADQTVLEMMDLMHSVFLHPEGGRHLREWFEENPESLQRWGGWFLLAEKYFLELLDQKMISAHWIVGFLLYGVEKKWESFWKRPLIVDLGSQLGKNEAEVLLELSHVCPLLVLAPSEEQQKKNEYLLQPYAMLSGFAQGQVRQIKFPSSLSSSNSTAVRFSGPLAECKYVCQTIRQWLDEKIPPSQIAVIAPDIENYWPWLQPLMKAEGIPLNKDVTARLQNLPSISRWLARLRLASGQIRYPDLERALYTDSEFPLRFEEFQALFSELISDQDLSRHQEIEKSFSSASVTIGKNSVMDVDQFMGFALKHWTRGWDWQPLEASLRELLGNGEILGALSLSSWVYFLEQVVAKKELKLEKAQTSGVEVTNLSSADSLRITHRLFVGLTENFLRGKKKSLLTPSEVLDISRKFGFFLEHPEVSVTEFDLQWQSQVQGMTSIFSFPQTGFSGSAEAPTQFWLQLSATAPTVDNNRWDQILKAETTQALTQEYQWASDRSQAAEEQISRDSGQAPFLDLKIAQPISLSPSSLERYRKCPFIFAAEKAFRLVDLPVVDLDVDRRTRGTLAHALLEKLSPEPRRFDWSEAEIRSVLEDLRESLGLRSMDSFVWRALVEKHIKMALRFLAFEKEWKRRFPETQVFASEKSFEAAWPGSEDANAGKPAWKIRGKIDRIDQDKSGRKIIIDYKVSPSDYKNFSSWVDKNQIQLGLYMIATQEGWITDVPASEVIGAFYYILKTMKRDAGLKVKEAAGSLFELDKKKNALSLVDKEKLLQEIKVLVGSLITEIQQGKIPPQPLSLDDCQDCHWRSLCRAPHLI